MQPDSPDEPVDREPVPARKRISDLFHETLDAHGMAGGPETIEPRKAVETHLAVAQHRIQLRLAPTEGLETVQRGPAAANFQDVLAKTFTGGRIKNTGFFERAVGIG